MSIQTPLNKCLDCGYAFDMASCVKDEAAMPKPGDISICLSCGHIMAFKGDMTVRPLTGAEQVSIAGDPEIIRIQKARDATMKRARG